MHIESLALTQYETNESAYTFNVPAVQLSKLL
jgi:hypothetical protein